MTDMRERVARAIHDGLGGNGWAYTNYGGDEFSTKRDELISAADAALLACGYVEMRKALAKLERAASNVNGRGATPGPQWVGLSAALVSARSILERTGEK